MHSEPARPRISVLLPVCNEERFLEQAAESILRQTESNFELIVVDDGSTDGSPALIKHFAAADPRDAEQANGPALFLHAHLR